MILGGPITTTAPLPDVDLFLRAMCHGCPDDETLFAPWADGGVALAFSRASWALYAAIEAVSRDAGIRPTVWMPDYICAAPVAPLRNIADLIFYPIDEALRPDWSACEAMATGRRTDVFILVHYFGAPSDAMGARQFCDRYGSILIEDAAHAALPGPEIGQVGDAVLWSLYKHLPIPDGGLLVIRDRGRIAAVRPLSSGTRAPSVIGWIMRRLVQRLCGRLIRRGAVLPYDADPIGMTTIPERSISGLARRLIAVMGEELSVLAERRRTNARALTGLLVSGSELAPAIDLTGPSVVPYRVVLRGRDPAHARFWYDRISASGNVVESWPDLPIEVRQNPTQHEYALALRSTLLAVPIHADRTPQELCAAYLNIGELRTL